MQKGLDFIINSGERTLKVGGVACHATELDPVSNADTPVSGATARYRRRDLEVLITELRRRGDEVWYLRTADDARGLDFYVYRLPDSQPPT